MINALMTHLWQSTLFAAPAGLLTIAFRKNRAKVRFWLWLSASLKFFIPFALLMSLGSQVKWTPAAHQIAARIATPAVSFAVEYVAQPFSGTLTIPTPAAQTARNTDWMPFAGLAIWACGFLAITVIRLTLWRRIRGVVRVSTPLGIPTTVEARVAPGLLEPGVVGLLNPVLLLPEGIVDRLTESQLEAVLAHELCHVRRRDNLFASIHMIVEAFFWFHPLVWWIGARLVAERERACDEDVLSLGNQPRIYADAILNVCRLYVESPLVCVSGVTGSDIKRRIEAIMANRGVQALNRAKKVLLATAGFVAVAGPVAIGIVIGIGHVPAIHAQAPPATPLPARIAILPISQVAQPAAAAQSPAASLVPDSPQILYKDRRLVVMYFDCDSMTSDEQALAKQAGISYLQKSLTPADVVSVIAYVGGRPVVKSDFTDNIPALASAIQGLSAPGGGESSTPGVDTKLTGIGQVATMLKGFPQKKTLIYYSSGADRAGTENDAQLQATIHLAQEANMAIYPIDARRATLAEKEERLRSELSTPYKKWLDDGVAYVISDEERKAFQASGPIGGIAGGAPVTGTPGGRGPGRGLAVPPTGVSEDEFYRRVTYATAKFGATTSAMGRAYILYGAPDQIDTPNSGTSQTWRYNYLESLHEGAAFEFSNTNPHSARVVYPPPSATFEGHAAVTTQLTPLAEALNKEPQNSGKPVSTSSISALPGGHVSIQIDAASPVMPAPANGKFASFLVPLGSLTGQIDVIAQVRNAAGQVAQMLRDTPQASASTYQSAFTLHPGSYTLNVLLKEQSTGRLFGETVDFDVK